MNMKLCFKRAQKFRSISVKIYVLHCKNRLKSLLHFWFDLCNLNSSFFIFSTSTYFPRIGVNCAYCYPGRLYIAAHSVLYYSFLFPIHNTRLIPSIVVHVFTENKEFIVDFVVFCSNREWTYFLHHVKFSFHICLYLQFCLRSFVSCFFRLFCCSPFTFVLSPYNRPGMYTYPVQMRLRRQVHRRRLQVRRSSRLSRPKWRGLPWILHRKRYTHRHS